MTVRRACALLLTASALALAACGGGRTTAATQPSPAAFDPAKSDPKAVAAVDAMLGVLGGPGAWTNVKQVQWDQKYTRDGKVAGWFKHSWDRWNGRQNERIHNVPPATRHIRPSAPDRRDGKPQLLPALDANQRWR